MSDSFTWLYLHVQVSTLVMQSHMKILYLSNVLLDFFVVFWTGNWNNDFIELPTARKENGIWG